MRHILQSLVVGAILGAIAFVTLYHGVLRPMLFGIVGAIIGGLIGRLFFKPAPGASFHLPSFIMSIIFAILFLLIGWVMNM